jgi:hypothetical protein
MAILFSKQINIAREISLRYSMRTKERQRHLNKMRVIVGKTKISQGGD